MQFFIFPSSVSPEDFPGKTLKPFFSSSVSFLSGISSSQTDKPDLCVGFGSFVRDKRRILSHVRSSCGYDTKLPNRHKGPVLSV